MTEFIIWQNLIFSWLIKSPGVSMPKNVYVHDNDKMIKLNKKVV